MKRLIGTAAVLACASLFSAAYYISETQATVQAGLTDLKFEVVKQEGGLIGAPTRLKITKATLEHLRGLMKNGKELSIAADGKISVVDGAKGSAKKTDE
jgi:hypothetical protein